MFGFIITVETPEGFTAHTVEWCKSDDQSDVIARYDELVSQVPSSTTRVRIVTTIDDYDLR